MRVQFSQNSYRVAFGMDNFLKISKGNETTIAFQVLDDAGAPVPLTDRDLRFTVKRNLNDADDRAWVSKSVVGGVSDGITVTFPDEGKGTIDMAPTDTADMPAGEYYFDLKLYDDAQRVSLNTPGIFRVLDVVTRA